MCVLQRNTLFLCLLPQVKDGEKTGERMEKTCTATVRGKVHTEGLLQTATLSAVNESNRKTAPGRVLFDSGSQRTWIRQARIQTGLSGLYKPVRFFRDGSTLNNSHNIFILNLNQFYCLSLFQ